MSSSWSSTPASSPPSVSAFTNDGPPPAPPPKSFRTSASPYMHHSPSMSIASSSGSHASGNAAAPPATAGAPGAWSRPAPQPFVNGRGNVQLTSAPRTFVGGPGSATSSSSTHSSPTLATAAAAPLAPPRGQQAYVRAPSPAISTSSLGSPNPGSYDGSGATSPTLSFPSQFGVRQRVALKSSRPQFGKGRGGGAVGRTVDDSHASRQSALPPAISIPASAPSSELGSPRHAVSSSFDGELGAASGRSTPSGWSHGERAREDDRGRRTLAPRDASPTPSTSALGSVLGSGDWVDDHPTPPARPPRPHSPGILAPSSQSLSPVPPALASASPIHSPTPVSSSSVLDRPRPKTPDPFGAGSFSSRPQQSYVAPLHAPRPSFSRHQSDRGQASPTTTTSSILDRPRPKTPDPYLPYSVRLPSSNSGHSLSGGGSPATSSSHHGARTHTPDAIVAPTPIQSGHDRERNGSIIDRPRPKTPDSAALFSFGAPRRGSDFPARPKTPDAGAVFGYAVEPGHERSNGSISVLDRPRPRTPDSQAWLDGTTSSNGRHTPNLSGGSTNGTAPAPARPTPPHVFSNAPASIVIKPTRIPLSPTSSFQSPPRQPHTALPPPPPVAPLNYTPRGTTSFDSQRNLPTSSSKDDLTPFFRRSSESSASSERASFDSSSHAVGRARFASVGAAPTLKLDLDLGGSETMFDLASLLKAGGGQTSPMKREFGKVEEEDERREKIKVPEKDRRPTQAHRRGNGSVGGSGGNGIGTGRKEPPKVDLKLELELEIEKAIPPYRPIVEGNASPFANIVPTPVIDSAPSVVEPPSPAPAKRRRSLASLLSLGSNADTTGPIRADPSTDSLASAAEPFLSTSTSLTDVSHAAPVLASYAFPSASSSSHGHGGRPSLGNLNNSLALDKSLPPTPHSPSPLHTPAATGSVVSDSPTKGALGRQLSKLRGRNYSASAASGPPSSSSSFQVLSASTTKKAGSFSFGSSGPRNASATSLPGQLAGMTASAPINNEPSSTPTSALGRRLVERFGGGKSSASPSSIRTSESTATNSSFAGDWTMRSEEIPMPPTTAGVAAAAAERVFPKPPRRGSFSGLLGSVTDKRKASIDDNGSDKAPTPPPAKDKSSPIMARAGALGMSLLSGRKSEDLLTTSSLKDREVPQEKGVQLLKEQRPPLIGRGSFDLLTERAKVPRRPSTDNLLNLATAKLSTLGKDESAVSSSAHSVSPYDSSSPTSRLSSSSLSHDAHDVSDTASVATATRVVRRPSEISLPPASAILGSTTASSDSSPPPPIFSRAHLVRNDDGNMVRSASKESNVSTATSDQGTPRPLNGSPGGGQWRKRNKIPDSGVGSDSSMSSAWLDLEDAGVLYAAAVSENRIDRGGILANTILPFLRREEVTPSPRADDELAKRQRQVLFGWLTTLTLELREMQPTHRGACLEAVAGIAESHFLSATVLHDDEIGQARYRSAIVQVLAFAIEKLNDKAVYANTLVFSGRVLALAFFRIEGVALKLLRALPPVKRQCLKRILDEAGVSEHQLPQVQLENFPSHLWPLCLRDLRAYTNLLLPVVPRPSTEDDSFLVKDGEISVEMSGNWLIRWTASDSDLPFAFYRAYHRQLASHLVPLEAREEIEGSRPLDPAYLITGPGALFVAASLLEKSDALVHRNLRSVTSIGPNNSNFNTNDSANLSFGQKPKILELANRRLVATMLDIVGGPPNAPGDVVEVAADAGARRFVFSRMLQVWIRACVKKTSMWDTRSVFILLDLLEGMIYTLSYPPVSASRGSEEELVVPRPHESCLEMFDIPFMFTFVKIILSQADNTVAIMRTIAFLYAHFEIFTLRPSDRTELCENIILDQALFPRLYLHWNAGVRGYFIRLLVWRLSRLGIVHAEQHPEEPRDPAIPILFGLMNMRLEAIRRRHDELEPLDNLTDDDLFVPKRSTICSTRGVKEAPFTVDELVAPVEEDSEDEDEPQEHVNAQPMLPLGGGHLQNNGKHSASRKDNATVARVVSWLKGGLGKKSKNSRGPVPESRVDPFVIGGMTESPSSALDDIDDAIAASASSQSQDSSWASASTSDTSGSDYGSMVAVTPERAERRAPRPSSPAFFAFDFESGLAARNNDNSGPSPTSSNASTTGSSTGTADTVFPHSPLRRQQLDPHSVVSPRVSLRFSKRISILPPAALDLLKESGEAVPPIPAQYRSSVQVSYDKKLHNYAVRSLREYEDALDEWTDWVARLQEETDLGKKHNVGFVDTVPRLAVSWPASFEEGG